MLLRFHVDRSVCSPFPTQEVVTASCIMRANKRSSSVVILVQNPLHAGIDSPVQRFVQLAQLPAQLGRGEQHLFLVTGKKLLAHELLFDQLARYFGNAAPRDAGMFGDRDPVRRFQFADRA